MACLILATVVAGTSGSVWYALEAGRATTEAMIARGEAEQQTAAAQAAALTAEEAARRMKQAQQREVEQRRRAERALYVSDIRLAESQVENSQHHKALLGLAQHFPQAGKEDLRSWEWYYMAGKTVRPLRDPAGLPGNSTSALG